MPENDDAQQGGQQNGENGAADFQAITSQEDFDRAIAKRIDRERAKFADFDTLKAKAEQFDAAEQANKTEVEKERERANAAEKLAAGLQANSLRVEVGSAKGLTLAQSRRLIGATKDELESDADQFLADLKPADTTTKQRRNPSDLKSGSSGDGRDSSGRAAAAVRALRQG